MIIDVVCYFNYRAASPGVSNKSKEKPCMSTPAFSRIRWRTAFPKVLVLLALLFGTVFSLASHLSTSAALPSNLPDGPVAISPYDPARHECPLHSARWQSLRLSTLCALRSQYQR